MNDELQQDLALLDQISTPAKGAWGSFFGLALVGIAVQAGGMWLLGRDGRLTGTETMLIMLAASVFIIAGFVISMRPMSRQAKLVQQFNRLPADRKQRARDARSRRDG